VSFLSLFPALFHPLFDSQATGEAAAAQLPTKPPPDAVAPPRFEIKKWNAVAMWSWDICADTVRATTTMMMDGVVFEGSVSTSTPIARVFRAGKMPARLRAYLFI
jgi:hypothetical protein